MQTFIFITFGEHNDFNENLMIFKEAINTRKSNEILNFLERHQPNVASICVFANQENQQFEPGCSGKQKSHMKLLEVHCLFGQVCKAWDCEISKMSILARTRDKN